MSSASSNWSSFLAVSLHLLSLEGGLQCAELPLMGVLGGVLGASIPFPC